MSWYVVGVDLGGSNLRALLCDEAGAGVRELRVPTRCESADAVLDQIEECARQVAAEAGVDWGAVRAVGVGAPGAVDDGGALRLAANLPPFGDLALAEAIGDRLGVPVVMENDVNMATVGEHRHGAGRGLTDLAFVAVGTGIGMGFMSGGRLHRGASGAAGEIANLPLGADPFDPENQRRGPLEEAASGSGLAARYATRTGVGRNAEEIFARAGAGDAQARAILADQATAVALALVTIHAVLDPPLIVLGGGIGSRPELIDRIRDPLSRLTTRRIPLIASALGHRAGLVGAAEVARQCAEQAAPGDRARRAAGRAAS
jgi:glucokinase